ncbi:MAG: hypothetical protein K0Q49_1970 [Haloplasmataceae bacterium]|jgi:hypothetical protein|nr:hypothetical protein [Haloplasmataceae bacterium]
MKSSIGGLLTSKFINRFGYQKSILFVFIVYSTVLMETLVKRYLHHHVDSNYHATAESFLSLLFRLFSIILG